MKKLRISQIFSKLEVTKPIIDYIALMHNFIVKFGNILDIFKEFAGNRVNDLGNVPRDQFMMIRNYAKQPKGLFTRIAAKVSALTILQYVNYVNHRNIGQVKYALI